jgi:hypothetical protein
MISGARCALVWDDEPGRPVWKGTGGAPGRRRYQRRTAKNGEELSPPHGLILRPRAHTITLPIRRVVHHSSLRQRMSALGHKRTFRNFRPMSALPPKADIHEARYERPVRGSGVRIRETAPPSRKAP